MELLSAVEFNLPFLLQSAFLFLYLFNFFCFIFFFLYDPFLPFFYSFARFLNNFLGRIFPSFFLSFFLVFLSSAFLHFSPLFYLPFLSVRLQVSAF